MAFQGLDASRRFCQNLQLIKVPFASLSFKTEPAQKSTSDLG
jgi:hypothetical protein